MRLPALLSLADVLIVVGGVVVVVFVAVIVVVVVRVAWLLLELLL